MSRTGSPPMIVREGRAQYDALQDRARRLALKVSEWADGFPTTPSGRNFADQLVRSATSTACNHRSARRARSKAEWIAKLGIVEEEADEVVFWLGMSMDKGFIATSVGIPLQVEASEILAIVIASIKTGRANLAAKSRNGKVSDHI